jgi:hypothetical protein
MADDRPPLDSFVKRPPLDSFVKKPAEKPGFWAGASASDFFKSIGRGAVSAASALGQAEAPLQGMEGVPGSEESAKLAGVPKPPPEQTGPGGRMVQALGETIGNPTSYMAGPPGLGTAASVLGGTIGGQLGSEVGGAPGAVVGGLVGGVAGGGVATAGRRFGTTPTAANLPETNDVQRANRAVQQTLERFGIQPSAGDFRGSPGLQRAEQTGGLLGGGGSYEANKIGAERQLTSAALRLMGTNGEAVIPETLGNPGTIRQAERRIGADFDRAQSLFEIEHTPLFQQELDTIRATAQAEGLDPTAMGRISAMLDRLDPARSPAGGAPRFSDLWTQQGNAFVMPGNSYKTLTEYKSNLSDMRRAPGRLGFYANAIYDAIEHQMQRSAVTPQQQEGLDLLRQARRQWYIKGIIEESINDSKVAGRQGLIDPDKLKRAAAGADPSTDIHQLGEAAGKVMTPPKPMSVFASSHETGQGMLRHAASGGAGALGAGLGFAAGGFPGAAVGATAGALGPGLFGRGVNSPAIQRYLKNAPLGSTRRERELRAAIGAAIGGRNEADNERKKSPLRKRPGAIYEE